MKRLVLLAVVVLSLTARADPAPVGVPVTYQLPTDGPLPRTYRVTLAIVDAKNPDWIIGQFANGVVRTVTAENGGKFTETWDGLDDNFMPVPPGDYGVKGIYMAASKWEVDGEYHSVTPKFVAGASSWMPPPERWEKPEPFGGDPTGAPLADVAVGANGVGVFYYQYLENGTNNPQFDLNKPVGYEQFIRAYNSGGAGGGTCTCTDGLSVWSFSTDGGPKFVYRADQKPFGTGGGAHRNNVYRPDGWVTAMAAYRDEPAKKSLVYVAQRGKFAEKRKGDFVESDADFVDKVTVHAGDGGRVVAEVPLRRPRGLAVRGEVLYALHEADEGGAMMVSTTVLEQGVPKGEWRRLFAVPKTVAPFDMEVDSRGRVYLSDPAANHVYEFDADGKPTHTFGRLDAQKPGTYDRDSLIAPGKLATWVDADGRDRLIIVEMGGPNRASEWSVESVTSGEGSPAPKLLREFQSLQTKANDGYAIDPQDPDHIYIAGQQHWLTRMKVDYEKHTFTVDAVWPNVGEDPRAPGLDHPRFVRVGGRAYLACGKSYNIYRLDGDRWRLSAALIRKRDAKGKVSVLAWHDANDDGRVEDEECAPLEAPGNFFTYHGGQWLDDLSLIAINQGGRDVWRLAPASFDEHGNPVFTAWTKTFTDPVFEERAANRADSTHGGNELADAFVSDWAMADGSVEEGFYIDARGGKNFSANEGPQVKISRYVPRLRPLSQGWPQGSTGYTLKWRTGRVAMQRLAQPGEIYGTIHIRKPINGLLSVVDQSRCGVLLYTEDGLYVDSVFPDGRRFSPNVAGVYPQPGEFFAGDVYPNVKNGKIYFAMGKYTPMIFEARGWGVKENPVRPLTTVQPSVTIAAPQIASPPEIALAVRGGAGAARVARFGPALGGASLDGSMGGWESAEPIRFEADKDQSVEVRCLYDPQNLYLRWHARLAAKFEPKALAPVERIFTHDRLADTLSFYIQSDPAAAPAISADGRTGDLRIVFGVFKDGDAVRPVALGLYPAARKGMKASPQTYATPVGRVTFAHVGEVEGAVLDAKIDADGKGFVLSAKIPAAALPNTLAFKGGLRTLVNFEATFGGHNKFWWANRDGSASRETYDEPTEARLYPGSWAPAEFSGVEGGVVVRNWQVLGPFGGPGAERFKADPSGKMKDEVKAFCAAAKYPADGPVDLAAKYSGETVRGYWPDPREVKWRAASIADLDTRVILGPSGQTWYGATWMHAPAETTVDFVFQGHPQTTLRYTLNGEVVFEGEMKEGPREGILRTARRRVTLRPGWNEVRFRGWCVGYPPFRAGLAVEGEAEKLWGVRMSGAGAGK